jgi:WD40 repeat protein
VSARIVLLLLVLSARPGASAEPGPPPREARFDKNGYLLPAGAIARLGVPTPLSEFPWSLAWSPDGKEFVAGDRSGVTRFDAATGRPIETLTFGDLFRSVYTPLSRDGRLLIFLNGPSATIFDTGTGTARGFNLPWPFADPDRKVYSLSLSDDFRFLTGITAPSAKPGVAWRYDRARDSFTRLVNDRADLTSVRISPDGKRLYAVGGSQEPELTARDLRTGRELWTVKLKATGTLRTVSADGRRLALTDKNGLTVYETADGKVVLREVIDTTTPKGMWAVDLSPDGRRAALSDCRKVTVWDLNAAKVSHTLEHAARLLAFSPDGKSLLTASGWVQRWNLESGKPAFPVPFIDRPVGASVLKWSRDGQRILNVWSGDRSGDERDWWPDVLAVWDVKTAEVSWRRASPRGVMAASFDRAGSLVLACTDDRQLRSWPVDGELRETSLAVGKPTESIRRSYAFLADGRLAVHTYGRDVQIDLYGPVGWIATKRPVWPPSTQPRTPPFFNPAVQGTIMFGPNGSRMDLVTGRVLPPLTIGTPFRSPLGEPISSPDAFVAGRLNAVGGMFAHVWESTTGRIIVDLPAFLPDWTGAVLSPDGRLIASADNDRFVMMDLAGPGRLRTFSVLGARALAFSPDGRLLASAQADGTVLIWDVPRTRAPWWTAESDRLWADLSADDAAPAWKVLWHLLDHPDQATELLSARLRPVRSWKDTAEQIARLDHPKYAVREEAVRVLAGRGMVVEEDLREALRRNPSAEQRERLEALLKKLDSAVPPTGETLRGVRCVWLLERIGTSDAKKLLAEVATGASGSRVTVEAKEALERLVK